MPRLVLSQNERIMLHLSELDKFRDEAEVPMAASQEGIAEKLSTQVFNASRALSSLESEGLVFDRLAHVRGAPKRRRAYFLTEKGRSTAHAIRSDIGKRTVVIEHAGKTQELVLDDAVRRLSSLLGRTVSYSEVVELGRESETILSSALSAQPSVGSPSKEFVVRAHGRPKVDSFFGRETELKTIEESVAGNDIGAMLIWGMPGIGKSTLASKFFESILGKRAMFWYSFREWDTETTFLAALFDFLSATGAGESLAASRRGAGRSEIYLPLLNDLASASAVLFLDDIQKPAKEVTSLLEVLVEAVKSSKGSKVVLISRTVPTMFSRTDKGNLSIELAGLDRDSAWKLAQSLDAKDAMRLVEGSHGHPLFLSLMARGGAIQAKDDIVSFIEREVYSSLSLDEMRLLELLSVYRHPVPVEGLNVRDYRMIAEMRKRALVTEQEEGIWTHDLLREFFTSHMTSENRSALHRLAAEYCQRQEGVEWSLEALHHFVEIGDWSGSSRVIVAGAVELGKEFPSETHSLLSRMNLSGLAERERAEILFIRGQIGETLGMHEAALLDYEDSLNLLGETDPAKRALVLGAQATIQAEAQRWSESFSSHQKALRIYEKSDDREGQAREWMSIGGVHRRKGDFTRAREAYQKALSLSTKAENRTAQAACLNNLGLLEWDEGNLGGAELRLKESVKLSHAVVDQEGEANGLENLANLYRAEGRLPEAANVLLESAEAFLRAGDVTGFKRLQASSAETLGMLGRFEAGIELCEKAFARPELSRRRGLFQRSPRYDAGDLALSHTLVELLRGAGDLRKAQRELARYATIADALGDPSLKARGKLLLSIVREEIGELDDAVKSLSEAEELLKSSGNHEGLVAVYIRRGIVEEKRGNYESAAEQYRNAARYAERVEDKTALRIAQESLRSVS